MLNCETHTLYFKLASPIRYKHAEHQCFVYALSKSRNLLEGPLPHSALMVKREEGIKKEVKGAGGGQGELGWI